MGLGFREGERGRMGREKHGNVSLAKNVQCF